LIDTLRRRCPASAGRKARERRLGEIPTKVFVKGPRRQKPKGAASGRRAKHTEVARDFEKAKTQELRPASRPDASAKGIQAGTNSRWVLLLGNEWDTFLKEEAPKGESHERCRREKKPARDAKGVNRQEGNQTLKAEHSGQANPRNVDLPSRYVL